MQFTPKGVDIDMIKASIEEIPDINDVHHVHVWQLNDKQIHFEAHVDLCRDMAISKTDDIHRQIRSLLKSKSKYSWWVMFKSVAQLSRAVFIKKQLGL